MAKKKAAPKEAAEALAPVEATEPDVEPVDALEPVEPVDPVEPEPLSPRDELLSLLPEGSTVEVVTVDGQRVFPMLSPPGTPGVRYRDAYVGWVAATAPASARASVRYFIGYSVVGYRSDSLAWDVAIAEAQDQAYAGLARHFAGNRPMPPFAPQGAALPGPGEWYPTLVV